MRTLLVVTALTISTSSVAQDRRTLGLSVAAEEEELVAEVELQMDAWQVSLRASPVGPSFEERVRNARRSLGALDAVAWFETNPVQTLVVVLVATDDVPRTSPLPPRDTLDWERAVALILDGLLSSEPLVLPPEPTSLAFDLADPSSAYQASSEAASTSPRPSGWPSPLARNGWMTRFGWFWAFSPRSANGFGAHTGYSDVAVDVSAGFRARVGRWLTRWFRIDVSAHVGKTWHFAGSGGVESGADVALMAVSATRLRMGAGVGFGALLVGERDAGSGNLFGWTGWWASLPLEIGFDFYRRSGMFVHMGPTLTKAPYTDSPHVGWMMSIEGEIDFGSFE
jgi:hypothetical protein